MPSCPGFAGRAPPASHGVLAAGSAQPRRSFSWEGQTPRAAALSWCRWIPSQNCHAYYKGERLEGRRFPSLPSPRYFTPLNQLAHHPAPMDSFPVRHDRCEFPKAVYFTAAFGDSLAVLLHLLWVSLALLAFSQSPFPAVQAHRVIEPLLLLSPGFGLSVDISSFGAWVDGEYCVPLVPFTFPGLLAQCAVGSW